MPASPTADIIAVRAAIAAAIATAIADGPVYGPIPASAVCEIYDAITKPQALAAGGGRIVVMPAERDSKPLNRALKKSRALKIDVAVQAKLKSIPALASEADPYLNLAIAIADVLVGRPLASLPPGAAALVKECEHVLFVPDHIAEFGVFTSILHLTVEYAA